MLAEPTFWLPPDFHLAIRRMRLRFLSSILLSQFRKGVLLDMANSILETISSEFASAAEKVGSSVVARGLVEGHSIGVIPCIWEYEEPHAQTDPTNCLECEELVLHHCKHLLSLLEQEKHRRAAR